MKQINIQYFALMREECGKEKELRQTESTDTGDLFDELMNQYGFSLTRKRLWVAVNDEIVSWNHSLNDGDKVVFIPPIAGG